MKAAERIYKYPLAVTDKQRVMMPRGARVLTAQIQGSQLCVWALVDPSAPPVPVTFWIVGDGNPAGHVAHAVYAGTVQQFGGQLVWHIFRKARDDDK